MICLETNDDIKFLKQHYDSKGRKYKFTLVDEEKIIKELVEERNKLVVKRERFGHEEFGVGGVYYGLLLRNDVIYDDVELYWSLDRDRKSDGITMKFDLPIYDTVVGYFPMESEGRLLYKIFPPLRWDMYPAELYPLVNSETFNNKTNESYTLYNEFFLFHNEEKTIQIWVKDSEEVRLTVKDHVGHIKQDLKTGKGTVVFTRIGIKKESKMGSSPNGRYLWFMQMREEGQPSVEIYEILPSQCEG